MWTHVPAARSARSTSRSSSRQVGWPRGRRCLPSSTSPELTTCRSEASIFPSERDRRGESSASAGWRASRAPASRDGWSGRRSRGCATVGSIGARPAALVPWGGGEDVRKISPVDASARVLRHLRDAWDAAFPEPLAAQEVVLTVPASFDEVARELTLEAARIAGLPAVVLLEEPQ